MRILSSLMAILVLAPALRADPAGLCIDAALAAARQTGVPIQVLLALTLTETGRTDADGGLAPWAWTLNQGGDGQWFDSREQAAAQLQTALDSGASNVDIGCFQLNWHWHGASFASAEAMLDPGANALYAAQHLLALYDSGGSWGAAVSAYHSATPEHAERYMARFEPIYDGLERLAAASSPPDAPLGPPRENRFPLLRAGEGQGRGSIVPLPGAARPLIGGS